MGLEGGLGLGLGFFFFFFGSRFISVAVKTESPLPRSFFAPKPNGNTVKPVLSGHPRGML